MTSRNAEPMAAASRAEEEAGFNQGCRTYESSRCNDQSNGFSHIGATDRCHGPGAQIGESRNRAADGATRAGHQCD